MLSKTVLFAFLSATAAVVSASPPGCLLGAINEYSKPADIKTVCSEKDITSNVSKKCGDNTQDALNALADICNEAGVKISNKVPTSSGSASPSGTGSSSSKDSSDAKATGSATENTASGSQSQPTGTPEPSTGAAAGNFEISAVALLASFGVVVAAL